MGALFTEKICCVRSEKKYTMHVMNAVLANAYRWYRFTWIHPNGEGRFCNANQQKKDSTHSQSSGFCFRDEN